MRIERPLVVIDLETTGTWKEKDRIVEIGMIKLLPGGTREIFLERVNPGITIPPEVSELIGRESFDQLGHRPDISRSFLAIRVGVVCGIKEAIPLECLGQAFGDHLGDRSILLLAKHFECG